MLRAGSFSHALTLLLLAMTAAAAGWPTNQVRGALVAVSIDVDGRTTPLHPAPDDRSRVYVEARRGAAYSVKLENLTHRRVGVVLLVDGLNVISGRLEPARGERQPGRMYVLDPAQRVVIHGWRSSLEQVHRFTFVDEGRSYAVRASKANPRIGWIEVAAYLERRPPARVAAPEAEPIVRAGRDQAGRSPLPEARAKSSREAGAARSFPGTGWGPGREDRAVLVDFEPAEAATDRLHLRYEYHDALVALGVLPELPRRLLERESGGIGFAQPPR
jgi:hypothetical protein